jgi:hypothetical protein
MKLSTLLCASALYAATTTTAWVLSLHSRNNKLLKMHGTVGVSCTDLEWGENRYEDIDHIQ